jgi:hypothetical protein
MVVDIEDLNEDDLLPTLGDGDWIIAMPQPYADLLVSAQWRDELITWTGICFVNWVLEGIHYEINYDNDPPWDHSGEVQRHRTRPLKS